MENKDTKIPKSNDYEIYKALPVETRLTLEKQSIKFGHNQSSIKGGEEFLVKFIEARTSSEIPDLSSTLKKVKHLHSLFHF